MRDLNEEFSDYKKRIAKRDKQINGLGAIVEQLRCELKEAINVIEIAYRERVLSDESITESDVHESLARCLYDYYGTDTMIAWADGFPETGNLSDFAKKFPGKTK